METDWGFWTYLIAGFFGSAFAILFFTILCQIFFRIKTMNDQALETHKHLLLLRLHCEVQGIDFNQATQAAQEHINQVQ